MAFDPFENIPDDEAQTEPQPEAPVQAPERPAKAPESTSKVVVTLKGGVGFDAPWIVVHADSVAEAEHTVKSSLELMRLAQVAASQFAKQAVAKPAQGGSTPAPAPSQGYREAPQGAPASPGPGWVFKSGVSAKTGKAWKGWMPPQGSNEKPVFF